MIIIIEFILRFHTCVCGESDTEEHAQGAFLFREHPLDGRRLRGVFLCCRFDRD